MKNYFYFLFSGLPAGNAHRGTMKNYFYILFFGLPARVAHRGTQKMVPCDLQIVIVEKGT